MDTFAFIIHPIDPKRDVSRKFLLLGKIFNENQIDFLSTFFPTDPPLGNYWDSISDYWKKSEGMADRLPIHTQTDDEFT